MPPKFKFTEGEKVLCFHGPLIYEAKALRCAMNKDKTTKYLIHYAGWSKNWDEWVPEARVLKYNEINTLRQKELANLHAANNAKNKKNSADAKAGTATATATVAVALPVAAKPKKSDSTSSSGKEVDSRSPTPSKELKDADTTQVPPPIVPADGVDTKAATTTTSGSNAASSETKTEASTTGHTTTKTVSSSSGTPTLSARSARGSKTTAYTPVASDEATKKKRARLDTNAQSTITSTSAAVTTADSAAANLAASAETEEQSNAKVEIKIKIPDDLKPWLVDDWDAINRQQKLIELPAKQTVQDIVAAYIAHKKSSKQPLHANKELAMNGITASLVDYFNVMLGCQLLYKFERPQYAELLEQHPNKPMSALYGAFHLLRLFTRLGSMLAVTTLDEKSGQMLLVHLQDFLKYLVKNAATLFSIQHFVDVTSEYHRKVQ